MADEIGDVQGRDESPKRVLTGPRPGSTSSHDSRLSCELWQPVADMLQYSALPPPPVLHIPDLAGDQLKLSTMSEKSARTIPRSESATSVRTATLVETVDLEDDGDDPSPVKVRRSSRDRTGFRPPKLDVDASPAGGLSSPEFETPQSRAPPCTPAHSLHAAAFPDLLKEDPSSAGLSQNTTHIHHRRTMRPMQAGAGTANMDEEASLMRVLFGSTEAEEDSDKDTIRVEDHWMNPFLVHPDSSIRHRWDLFAIVLVIYTTFLLPARTAFLWQMWDDETPQETDTRWDYFQVMDLFIDIFFMCDVCFNFVTGYVSQGDSDIVVMYGPMIARRYLMGWFTMDVVASLPLDLMVIGSSSALWKLPRVIKILRLSRLLRLLRLSRMLRYLARFNIQERLQISDFQLRIGKLVCAVIMFLHWSACVQWLVVAAQDYPDDSWAAQQVLEDETIFVQYSWSLFRAVSHMFCIGYGQLPPINVVEAHTVNASVILGASLFTMFVGIVTSLLIQTDAANAEFTMKLDTVNRYMAHRRLPLDLRQRIRDSFEYRWRSQRIMDEHTILDELPVSLRTDVTTYNCRTLLENVPFFQNCEPGLIPTVVRLLAPNIFLSGDVIVRYGECPGEVYFIQSGEVQIVLFSKVVTYLSQGSFFGEMAFLLPGRRRTADVHAVKDCELFSLKKEHLDNVLIHFPEVKAAMMRIAQHRNAYLEEFCKQTAPTVPQLEEEVRTSHMDTMMNKMIKLEERESERSRRSVRRLLSSASLLSSALDVVRSKLPALAPRESVVLSRSNSAAAGMPSTPPLRPPPPTPSPTGDTPLPVPHTVSQAESGAATPRFRSRRSRSIHEVADLKRSSLSAVQKRKSQLPATTIAAMQGLRRAAGPAPALFDPSPSAYTTQWHAGNGMGFARPRVVRSVHESIDPDSWLGTAATAPVSASQHGVPLPQAAPRDESLA